jgi:hypothetical protein
MLKTGVVDPDSDAHPVRSETFNMIPVRILILIGKNKSGSGELWILNEFEVISQQKCSIKNLFLFYKKILKKANISS